MWRNDFDVLIFKNSFHIYSFNISNNLCIIAKIKLGQFIYIFIVRSVYYFYLVIGLEKIKPSMYNFLTFWEKISNVSYLFFSMTNHFDNLSFQNETSKTRAFILSYMHVFSRRSPRLKFSWSPVVRRLSVSLSAIRSFRSSVRPGCLFVNFSQFHFLL